MASGHKLQFTQSLQQKLSPQQIQFIKLLQVPTAELDSRIEDELEENPALEEGREEAETPEAEDDGNDDIERQEEISLDDYLKEEDYGGYKMQGDGNYAEEEDRQMPLSTGTTLVEQLLTQLGYENLDERSEAIAQHLIGSIDSDGYIRRDLEAVVNDLAFSQGIETDTDELEELLAIIHTFDPPGIGARDLQECLRLQLQRREEAGFEVSTAMAIVERCFTEFTKKHYDRISRKLNLTDDELKEAITTITRLNPKPGGGDGEMVKTQYLIPDFMLTKNGHELELTLNSRNAPELRISRSYSEMMEAYDKSDKKDKKLRQTVSFVKQKLDSAKWFIDAIKQRQNTLLNTMQAILDFQIEFFRTGDESKLRPMILKDIAETVNMDISTISRVANSKAIQTDFGIFPLKYFFSEGISTDSGEDVSSREVKHKLKTIIEGEDKKKPLSDDRLEKLLRLEGYNIARRTVAKYREQLDIPVARLRKEL